MVRAEFSHYLSLFLSNQLTLLIDVIYRDSPPLWMHPIEPGRGSTNAIRKRLYGINRNKLKIIKKIFKDNKHLCVQYGNFNLLLKLLLNPTEQL